MVLRDLRNAAADFCSAQVLSRRGIGNSDLLEIRCIAQQLDACFLDADIDCDQPVTDAARVQFLRRAEFEFFERIEIGILPDDEAGPVRVLDIEDHICTHPIDGQPLAYGFGHRGRKDKAVAAIDHQNSKQSHHATLRVTPRCWQTSCLGQTLHVLGELPL